MPQPKLDQITPKARMVSIRLRVVSSSNDGSPGSIRQRLVLSSNDGSMGSIRQRLGLSYNDGSMGSITQSQVLRSKNGLLGSASYKTELISEGLQGSPTQSPLLNHIEGDVLMVLPPFFNLLSFSKRFYTFITTATHATLIILKAQL